MEEACARIYRSMESLQSLVWEKTKKVIRVCVFFCVSVLVRVSFFDEIVKQKQHQ